MLASRPETIDLERDVVRSRNYAAGPGQWIDWGQAPLLQDDSLLREGTIVYPDEVTVGWGFQTGHYALLRGDVTIGNNVRVGSYTSVEGKVTIGDDTVIRGRCEIPSCTIGNRVSIYAYTMFMDTPNPLNGILKPPVIEDDVTLGCDVRVLGGVTVGKGSFVCAGTFVQTDVPPGSYVKRDGTVERLR